MRYLWSTITVSNMEASLKFYQEVLGLTVKRHYTAPSGTELAFLGEGSTEIELIHHPDHPAPGRVEGISLGFEVADLDEAMATFTEKGIAIESGPFQPNPMIRFFYVRDPDGVSIQLVEQKD